MIGEPSQDETAALPLTPAPRFGAIVEAFLSAYRSGAPRPIESWLGEVPESERATLRHQLLSEEIRLRMESGETPDWTEYRRRFPESSDSLDAMIEALFSTRAQTPADMSKQTTWVHREPSAPATRDWTGLVLGDYKMLARIGGGGMGAVYRALHAYLDCEMAVKVVLPDRQDHRGSVERFFREMKAVGRLDHPNIVRCNDAREVDGVPLLVMELLSGRDLQRLVAERGPLPVAVACDLIRQAALGLAHAHERGLVHRDVKPSNLFLTDAGVLKLLDLGLSTVQFGDEPAEGSVDLTDGLTVEGQALGTPDYMAPEQWTDALNADARADLYGLGATLYFLLAARPPFVGHGYSTFHGKMQGHLNDTPPALCSLRADVPLVLAGIVDRALSKSPADRQATAAEFAEAVRPFRDGVDLSTWLGTPGRPVAHRSDDATSVAAGPPQSASTQVDEDVQFTVYRPKAVVPEEWRPLLVFAHLAERRADAPPGEPDPVAEVRRQAEQVLGAAVDRFQPSTQEAAEAVPRGDTLTFVPAADGVEFNPPSRCFAWVESVHREEFRFRAARGLDGKTARGRVSVYLGQILLAEIPIKFRVDSAHIEPADAPLEPSPGRRFRRIYASFAGDDRAIAEEFEGFARLMGDEYLLGCASLRTADVWDDRVRERIRQADVFQLFWSSRALASPQVEREWQYALGLNRHDFIRPVYWEDPLPSDPGRDLPPEALKVCEFQKLVRSAVPPKPEPSEAADAGEPLIAGRYRRLRSLGAGRWQAHDTTFGRSVVVRAVEPDVVRKPAAFQRFRRDYQQVARLRCPSVATNYELFDDAGTTYLVQEYIEGERLSERIRREGSLDPDALRPILNGVCQAIAAAHEVGVVHGDLKPHNIFLTPGGPKVTALGEEAVRQSQSSQALTVYRPPTVSIQHAAPEVVMGEPATPASDVFSIGAIAFEALTGTPLASSPMERMQSFRQPPPSMRGRNPRASIPSAIEQVVHRCLDFEPSRRFGAVAELSAALERAWTSGELAEPLPQAAAAQPPAERMRPMSPERFEPDDPAPVRPIRYKHAAEAPRSPAARARLRWPLLLGLLLAIGMGVSLAWSTLRRIREQFTEVAAPVGQPEQPKSKNRSNE